MSRANSGGGFRGNQQQGQQREKVDPYGSDEFKRLLSMESMRKEVKFTSIESNREISLTPAAVLRFIAKPTKLGNWPTEQDCVKFVKLCEARQLDPWQGDAFLVGYDGKDGPEFSLITSIQALLKRAESSPKFRGIEQGVIIAGAVKGQLVYRKGDFVMPGEQLLGGWAKAYIDGWDVPCEDALALGPFDKGFSQWNSNKAGMIVKCAQASVLRTAFPSMLSALYCREEMASGDFSDLIKRKPHVGPLPRTLDDLGPPKPEKSQSGDVQRPTAPPQDELPSETDFADDVPQQGDAPEPSSFDEAKARKLFSACKTKEEVTQCGDDLLATTNPTEDQKSAIGGLEMEALQRIEQAAK